MMTREAWRRRRADGLCLQATTWQPQDPPKAVITLLHGLGLPTERLAPVAEALCAAGYRVVGSVQADPRCHRTVTTGWGLAMLQAIALAQAEASRFPVPLLRLHGTREAIADASGREAFAATAPAGRVTLRLWQGFGHDLHRDPDREVVFRALIAWLDQRLARDCEA